MNLLCGAIDATLDCSLSLEWSNGNKEALPKHTFLAEHFIYMCNVSLRLQEPNVLIFIIQLLQP
jgi:hypothetical protein